MTVSPCIRVWLGGSFDPIHVGHLQMIAHVYHLLCQTFPDLKIIAKLLPTAGSPLKDKPTANAQRLAMLSLAIETMPFLSIDEYELHCAPPVYSVNSFSHFKQQYPNDILVFIMGQDSVAQLDRWYRGFELITLTNLWVLLRPALLVNLNVLTPITQSHSPTLMLDSRLQPFLINSPKHLINQSTNHIYIDDFVVPDIASRDIRHWIKLATPDALQQAKASLPSAVYDYIIAHQLYI